MSNIVCLNKPGYMYVGIYLLLQRYCFVFLYVIWSTYNSPYMTHSIFSVSYLYEIMKGVYTLPLFRQGWLLVQAYIPVELGNFLGESLLGICLETLQGVWILCYWIFFCGYYVCTDGICVSIIYNSIPPTVHRIRKGSFFWVQWLTQAYIYMSLRLGNMF